MNVEAIEAEFVAESAPQMPEELSPSANAIAAKRLLKQYGVKLAATLGVVTAVILVVNRRDKTEETPEED